MIICYVFIVCSIKLCVNMYCIRYRLRPRMLRDASNVNMKTTIIGNGIDFPIGIAPTGLQKMAHPEEVATAKGIMISL